MYCSQFRPKPYEPSLHSTPTSEEYRYLIHRRFYGALLLRDLGCCGGNERLLSDVEKLYRVDHGELQRFWETCEMYVQLVRSMCEALNWGVLVRLLNSLRSWFKSRIPRSFECFLHEEDHIPLACLQVLVSEELEVKDVAEMSAEQLCGLLRSGCGNVMGMETVGGCEVKGAEIRMARRRDFEWFLDDMMRISEVMKRRACERRVRLAGNRELTKLLEELNANGDMSILLSPLASESRKLQNAMENEESEGERSDGVLSVSEGEKSEREEEERGKKQCCLEHYGSGECILTSEKLHNYSVL